MLKIDKLINNKYFMKKIILAVYALFMFGTLMAVPAYPGLVELKQADGTILMVYIKGDEKVNWVESEDGFTLLPNKDGIYEYAIENTNGSLVCSGVKYNNISDRSDDEKEFNAQLKPHLRFSKAQVNVLKQAWEMPVNKVRKLSTNYAQGPKIHKMPIILVAFADIDFIYSKKDFEDLINKPNYNLDGATGSVHDYFLDNSNGLLDFHADIYGPYTLSRNRKYYGENVMGDDKYPEKMVEEAISLAHADGCNYSMYDANNDGMLDGLHIIFAERGEEGGGDASAIWSHAWMLSPPKNIDGIKIEQYSCSPELFQKNKLTNIGVIVHEISHTLGLLDYYDTDYTSSDGQAVDLGDFDVMAGGSWNNDGKTPPLHNAWSKVFLGWQRPVELLDSADIEFLPSEKSSVAYFYSTKTAKEYFYLDNRGSSKWDEYIPGKGLLIYHINEAYSGWKNNCINCDPRNRGFYIKQAGGNLLSTSLLNESTPFPGSKNKTIFTDETVPPAKSKAGELTEKPITSIAYDENSGVISFQFNGGGSLVSDNFEIDTTKVELDGSAGSSKSINVLSPVYVWEIHGCSSPDFEIVSKWDNSSIEIKALQDNRTGELRQAKFWVSSYGRDSVEIEITQKYNVSLENTENRNFSIFPNPVSNGEFNITANEGINEVKIYSVEGRCVKTISGNDKTELTVGVNKLKKGLYFVNIHTKTGIFTQKLIKH